MKEQLSIWKNVKKCVFKFIKAKKMKDIAEFCAPLELPTHIFGKKK